LVSHAPDYLATALPAAKGTFDLALSGHTHGGQVTLFGLWAPILPSRYGQRYSRGWLTEEGVPVLVTRGVATVGPPLRFFARPQLHVIELKRGPAGVTH
jgi:predicted MPP superfamily phosphohydrolase